MTQPRIHLTETAVTDMENIVTWYIEQGAPDVGRRLVTEIMQRIETLAAHPEIGRVVPEFNQPQVQELIPPAVSCRVPIRSKTLSRRNPGRTGMA